MGREQAHPHRAESATERHSEIKRSQVAQGRFCAHQLAMTKKADDKKATAEKGHADLNRVRERRIVDGVSGGSQCNGEKTRQQPAWIEFVFCKNNRERKQVKR